MEECFAAAVIGGSFKLQQEMVFWQQIVNGYFPFKTHFFSY